MEFMRKENLYLCIIYAFYILISGCNQNTIEDESKIFHKEERVSRVDCFHYFVPYPEPIPALQGDKVISNIEALDECNTSCRIEKDFTCRGFDYCKIKQVCILRKEHILDLNPGETGTSSRDACVHYAGNGFSTPGICFNYDTQLFAIHDTVRMNFTSAAQFCKENRNFDLYIPETEKQLKDLVEAYKLEKGEKEGARTFWTKLSNCCPKSHEWAVEAASENNRTFRSRRCAIVTVNIALNTKIPLTLNDQESSNAVICTEKKHKDNSEKLNIAQSDEVKHFALFSEHTTVEYKNKNPSITEIKCPKEIRYANPTVCFSSDTEMYVFYNENKTQLQANDECSVIHDSKLYEPKQEDLENLVKAYKRWDKDAKGPKTFWTDLKFTGSLTASYDSWAINTARKNFLQYENDPNSFLGYKVIVNISLSQSFPLYLGGNKHAFICAFERRKEFSVEHDIVETKCPYGHDKNPAVCFNSETQIYAFFFHKMNAKRAQEFCKENNYSGLYHPKEEDLENLVDAYRCWNIALLDYTLFWTKVEFKSKVTDDPDSWSIRKVIKNLGDSVQTKILEESHHVVVDTDRKTPLFLEEVNKPIDFICTVEKLKQLNETRTTSPSDVAQYTTTISGETASTIGNLDIVKTDCATIKHDSNRSSTPDVCFKYNGQVFAIYDVQMDFPSAVLFCKKHHNFDLYIPETEKQLENLVEAYKLENTGENEGAQTFWTKLNSCCTKYKAWAVAAAAKNTPSFRSHRCPVVTVNITLENKIPLTMSDQEGNAVICAEKIPKDISGKLNITQSGEVKHFTLFSEDTAVENKNKYQNIMEIKCPEEISFTNPTVCFSSDTEIYVFYNENKTQLEAREKCKKHGDLDSKLYYPKQEDLESLVKAYKGWDTDSKGPKTFWTDLTFNGSLTASYDSWAINTSIKNFRPYANNPDYPWRYKVIVNISLLQNFPLYLGDHYHAFICTFERKISMTQDIVETECPYGYYKNPAVCFSSKTQIYAFFFYKMNARRAQEFCKENNYSGLYHPKEEDLESLVEAYRCWHTAFLDHNILWTKVKFGYKPTDDPDSWSIRKVSENFGSFKVEKTYKKLHHIVIDIDRAFPLFLEEDNALNDFICSAEKLKELNETSTTSPSPPKVSETIDESQVNKTTIKNVITESFTESSTLNEVKVTAIPRPKECKPIEDDRGIKWPRTEAGKKAFGRCPRGEYGKAVWHCGRRGIFEGNPIIDCKEVNCSVPPSDKTYFESYLAEKAIVCTENPKEAMDDLMDDIRMMRDEVRTNRSKLKDNDKKVEEVVSAALGAIDKLIEPNVKIWDKMEKKQRITVTMDIMKETEETAWLMGCSSKETKLQQQNLAVQVIILNKTKEIEFVLDDDENKQDFAILPKVMKVKKGKSVGTCGSREVSTAVSVMYKNIQKFLLSDGGQYNVTSNVMGVSVGDYNDTYEFSDGERIRIRLNHPPKDPNITARCVFLNWNSKKSPRYGVWNTTGCETIVSEENYTECLCNHLTHFAILMDYSDVKLSETDIRVLSSMSLVFCVLSSTGLVFTIVVFIGVKSLRNKRNIFTCNLAACLLCMNILVQTGLKRVGNIKCMVISALLQYCVLCSFLWMFMEGVLLYKMVILVFETSRIRLPVVYALAYGIPLIIVIVSSSISPDQMIRDNYCWPSPDKGVVWGVIGPVAVIILINLTIFAMTLKAAFRINKMDTNKKSIRENKKSLIVRLKGMLSLTCLLGLTWVVGFFYVPNNPTPTAYAFVTLNGLQGFFLFLTQVALNSQVREKLLLIYKENLDKLSTATISVKNSVLRTLKQTHKVAPATKEDSLVFSDISPPHEYKRHSSVSTVSSPEPTAVLTEKTYNYVKEHEKYIIFSNISSPNLDNCILTTSPPEKSNSQNTSANYEEHHEDSIVFSDMSPPNSNSYNKCVSTKPPPKPTISFPEKESSKVPDNDKEHENSIVSDGISRPDWAACNDSMSAALSPEPTEAFPEISTSNTSDYDEEHANSMIFRKRIPSSWYDCNESVSTASSFDPIVPFSEKSCSRSSNNDEEQDDSKVFIKRIPSNWNDYNESVSTTPSFKSVVPSPEKSCSKSPNNDEEQDDSKVFIKRIPSNWNDYNESVSTTPPFKSVVPSPEKSCSKSPNNDEEQDDSKVFIKRIPSNWNDYNESVSTTPPFKSVVPSPEKSCSKSPNNDEEQTNNMVFIKRIPSIWHECNDSVSTAPSSGLIASSPEKSCSNTSNYDKEQANSMVFRRRIPLSWYDCNDSVSAAQSPEPTISSSDQSSSKTSTDNEELQSTPVYSMIAPLNLCDCNNSMPTALSSDPSVATSEKSSSKASNSDKKWHHPFEINYDK